MATYLPNINRYVSKTKAFTPDFKFLSDALEKRQDRYDTNYKKMNNLYGSVLHADLSRDDNIYRRDEYVKNLAPRIQQISGMDLSLQQNVDAAKGVFTPFFEDDKMVRDIVFTKRYNNELQKFNQFRKSNDEKIRSKFWQGGVDMLNFSMADFKKGTRENSMTVALPELVENVDLVERGFAKLKESGMNVQDVTLSPDGHFIITQKNGVALTRRPTGNKHPETGEMIYYNPAQTYILETIMDDPQVLRYYNTKWYVEARKFYEANAEQYGGEDNAKKFYAKQMLEKYKQYASVQNEEHQKELDNSTTGLNAWEDYKKNGGNLIPGSEEMTTWERHLAEAEYLKNAQKLREQKEREITDSEDIDALMRSAGNAYIRYHIDKDTKMAAARYADVNSERSIKTNDYALADHKHKLNLIEKAADHSNKLNQTMFEKGYTMDDQGNMIPLPWAEGGFGNNREGTDVGVNFGPGGPNQVEAGDANTTGVVAPDETFDVITDNMNTTNEGLNSIKNNRFAIVEAYYSTMANSITSDDNTYSTEGMKVDGKFMTWEEAKKYYTTEGNGDKLKKLYKNILNIAKHDVDDVAGPDLERSHPNLYSKIKGLEMDIDNTTTKLLVGWDEQTKVYNGVIEKMMATKEITMLEARMLEAYPLFNSRGIAADPEQIQEKMVQDFANYINGNSNLSAEDAAASFGFYDVEDMNNTINGAKNGGVNIARKHFNNVFDEFWGKHSIEGLFNEVKVKMNKMMNNASAIPGIQNYNLKSHMTNQKQAGTGGLIYNFHTSEYQNGGFNPQANEQLRLINNLISGPSQNYQVMLGDMSSGKNIDGDDVEIVTDPSAMLSLKELLRDLKLNPNSFSKGKGPNFTIKWSERLGGKGDKSGWVITYGEEYASTHKSSNAKSNNNIALTLPQNSITVFSSTEYGELNPNSVKNSYVSTTEFLVDLNKSREIHNDGGHVIFYKNSNGQMMYRAAVSSYNKETGDIEIGGYSEPQILPPSGYEVDLIFDRFNTQLETNAKDNQSAMKAHKKELTTTQE